MKIIVAMTTFLMTTSINAETLSFPSFQIEVGDGWVHKIERTQAHPERGGRIILSHPNGMGILKMGSYSAPGDVSRERLRLLTNVDISKPLSWQSWGDFSGYQYNYLERGSFNRQWWLVNERTIIFVTYNCDPESKDIETEKIDKIVNSITVNMP